MTISDARCIEGVCEGYVHVWRPDEWPERSPCVLMKLLILLLLVKYLMRLCTWVSWADLHSGSHRAFRMPAGDE